MKGDFPSETPFFITRPSSLHSIHWEARYSIFRDAGTGQTRVPTRTQKSVFIFPLFWFFFSFNFRRFKRTRRRFQAKLAASFLFLTAKNINFFFVLMINKNFRSLSVWWFPPYEIKLAFSSARLTTIVLVIDYFDTFQNSDPC